MGCICLVQKVEHSLHARGHSDTPVPRPFLPTAKTPEDQAKEVVELLLRRNLLQRCERMFKRPPPGSKKLVKFPKKLVPPGPGDVKVCSYYNYLLI